MSSTEPASLIPTTLLPGFLGSGKTTVLNHVLKQPGMAATAVIVNEFGEIGLDHLLVERSSEDVVLLNSGCLCCTVRNDIVDTLTSLFVDRANSKVPWFTRVVIETTGLADPAPILFTLGTDPMLDHRLRLASVVTLVDTVYGATTLDRFAEAARQAALADLLVITKTDLAPLGAELVQRLDLINDRAERVPGADASDAGALLFGAVPRASAPVIPAEPVAAHTHGIDAFSMVLGGEVSRLAFARALGGLARERGNDLLRVKGIVRFADRPEHPAVVQAAQHAMFAPEWLDDWPPDWPEGDRRSRLVFVVHEIPRAEILDAFAFAAPSIRRAPS